MRVLISGVEYERLFKINMKSRKGILLYGIGVDLIRKGNSISIGMESMKGLFR